MFKLHKLSFLPILATIISSDFSVGQIINAVPQEVYRYCYVVETKEWYRNQQKLWQQKLKNNPRNENAWYNYFFAARYGWADIQGQTNTREALMDSIFKEMSKAIPNSWVYHYIHYYNYGTDFSRLEKAYQINPHEPDLYWEFIKEYTLTGQKAKRHEFCKKLYESKDISTGIYNLNFNMLNSASENSVLFTNGDNDTYPAWILQDVKSIRPDILILTIHGIFSNRDYLKSTLLDRGIKIDIEKLSREDVFVFFHSLMELLHIAYPTTAIHIARTVYPPYYEKFKDKLNLTGIVFTYSENHFNSYEIHRDLMEQKLSLDYLAYDWYDELHVSQQLVNQLNLIYIEPFIKLAEYHRKHDNNSVAKKWLNEALVLARKVNDEAAINKISKMID